MKKREMKEKREGERDREGRRERYRKVGRGREREHNRCNVDKKERRTDIEFIAGRSGNNPLSCGREST